MVIVEVSSLLVGGAVGVLLEVVVLSPLRKLHSSILECRAVTTMLRGVPVEFPLSGSWKRSAAGYGWHSILFVFFYMAALLGALALEFGMEGTVVYRGPSGDAIEASGEIPFLGVVETRDGEPPKMTLFPTVPTIPEGVLAASSSKCRETTVVSSSDVETEFLGFTVGTAEEGDSLDIVGPEVCSSSQWLRFRDYGSETISRSSGFTSSDRWSWPWPVSLAASLGSEEGTIVVESGTMGIYKDGGKSSPSTYDATQFTFSTVDSDSTVTVAHKLTPEGCYMNICDGPNLPAGIVDVYSCWLMKDAIGDKCYTGFLALLSFEALQTGIWNTASSVDNFSRWHNRWGAHQYWLRQPYDHNRTSSTLANLLSGAEGDDVRSPWESISITDFKTTSRQATEFKWWALPSAAVAVMSTLAALVAAKCAKKWKERSGVTGGMWSLVANDLQQKHPCGQGGTVALAVTDRGSHQHVGLMWGRRPSVRDMTKPLMGTGERYGVATYSQDRQGER